MLLRRTYPSLLLMLAGGVAAFGATGALDALPVSSAAGVEFHVSPQGSDQNPGTAQKPFASLIRARDAVRDWKMHAGGMTAAASIVLHNGEYRMDKPVTLTPADSGVPGKPLVIAAAAGETPVLTSAGAITGWRQIAGDIPGLAPEAQGHVWEANVPRGWRFHFLYADGKPMPVARSSKGAEWHRWPKPVAVGNLGPEGQELTFPPGLLDNLPNNGDVEINLMPVQYWNTISVLKDIDPSRNTAYRRSKSPTTFWRNSFNEDGNYNLLNALKFLTAPGEWCVDSAAGKVYFWPESGSPLQMRIVAPTAYHLLELLGNSEQHVLVHDIEVRGITFDITDRLPEDQWPDAWVKRNAELPDATLMMDGVEHCAVEGCTFRQTGAYAVELQNYAQGNVIARNEMDHPGCGGVLLQGYGPGTTDVNRGNLIALNYVHDAGAGGYLHSAAFTLYQSGSNEIEFNLLSHLPYTGIVIVGANFNECGSGPHSDAMDSYGNGEALYGTRWRELPGGGHATPISRADFKKYLHGRDNHIHDNILTDYMDIMGDGGAIYSWGCGTGNVWEGNLLRRTRHHLGEQWAFALYMDDFVDGATLRDNIAWHNSNATINKGANTWTNNIVSSTKPDGFDRRLVEIARAAKSKGGWLRISDEASIPGLVISGSSPFVNNTTVTLTALAEGMVHYTTDGSQPTVASAAYAGPFTISHTATVRATVFDATGIPLAIAQSDVARIEPKPLSAGQWVNATEALQLGGPRFEANRESIGWCEGGGAIAFGPFEIGPEPLPAMDIMAGVDPHYAGGKVHIRLDTRNGPEIGATTFNSTGGFDKFGPHTLPLKAITAGNHVLWFVFEGGSGICDFRKFCFLQSMQTDGD